MPDRMPEDMPDKMPEDTSDRMPEDLPVTKRINVMVGITRSTVICVFCYRYDCRCHGSSFERNSFVPKVLAEGMANSQGQLEDAKYIERCNRMIEKVMSEDMDSLPDVCRLWNRNTDWKGHWPRFLARVGRYHLCQVEEAIPALEQLRLRWQEMMEQSLPEASWIYEAECQLEQMRDTVRAFK